MMAAQINHAAGGSQLIAPHGYYIERIRPTPHSDAENAQRLMTGAAWDEFCEHLKRAERDILEGGFEMAPIDYADGFYYLAGLVETGIQQALTFSTPDLPRFFRSPDTRSKWGAENPDNLYLWTKIRPDRTYKVTGTLSNCHEIIFELHDGYMQLGDVKFSPPLAASQLALNKDRSFEIVLSADKHGGNWLQLRPEYRYLVVRQYFYDWASERPTDLRIVQVGAEGVAPRRLSLPVAWPSCWTKQGCGRRRRQSIGDIGCGNCSAASGAARSRHPICRPGEL